MLHLDEIIEEDHAPVSAVNAKHWHVRFTYLDHEGNAFIPLARIAVQGNGDDPPSEAETRRGWLSLELDTSEDARFLADLWSDEGMIDNRAVTRAAIEQVTGMCAGCLVKAGRAEVSKEMAWLSVAANKMPV